jgi:hypothetical protein
MKIVPNTASHLSLPQFNSTLIDAALQEVSQIFEHHQNDIDCVSNDVRAFEKYVKSKNVAVSHSQEFSLTNAPDILLLWDKGPGDCKEFRLRCAVREWSDEEGQQGWRYTDVRPLIECPLSLRMAAYPFLPRFLKSLAKAIQIFHRPAQTVVSEDGEILF